MTAAADLALALAEVATPAAAEDLSRYRAEPVLYARERLGVELLPNQQCLAYAFAGLWHRITPEMAELAHLTNPGKRKIAVRSGQKTGKSKCIIVLSLWHYECFAMSRTFMCAAIGNQTRTVLWKELFDTLRVARVRGDELCDGIAGVPREKPSEDPNRGLLSADRSREIKGFTGRTVESVAGFSGSMIAYFIDEASYLEKLKYEAIKGNTAGGGDLGAPIVFTSQPTRNNGPFFDAFHAKADDWTTMAFDAEEIAAYQDRHGLSLPGMATVTRLAEWKKEDGEDSPFYQLRVRGAFLLNETGRIVPMHYITQAQELWKALRDDELEGPLAIGFDPAGPGDAGDEHGFAVVRGNKCIELDAIRGLNEEKALEEVYRLLRKYRRADETPRVMVDAEGNLGSAFYGRLRAESLHRRVNDVRNAFNVYGVRTSSRHVNDPTKFNRVRDEVWWNLAQWMKSGAVPLDHKLEQELHEPAWLSMPDGRIRATPKTDLRDALARSTDRADALGLAVDPPRVFRLQDPAPGDAHGGGGNSGDANAWGYQGGGGDDPGPGPEDPNGWGYS